MSDFTENDLRAIERDRDLPTDELFTGVDPADPYGEARAYLADARDALLGDVDPEDAIRCAQKAIARIEAAL